MYYPSDEVLHNRKMIEIQKLENVAMKGIYKKKRQKF